MVHPEPSKEARKRQIKVTALNFGKWKVLVLPVLDVLKQLRHDVLKPIRTLYVVASIHLTKLQQNYNTNLIVL